MLQLLQSSGGGLACGPEGPCGRNPSPRPTNQWTQVTSPAHVEPLCCATYTKQPHELSLCGRHLPWLIPNLQNMTGHGASENLPLKTMLCTIFKA